MDQLTKKIITKINKIITDKNTCVVAIDGMSTSGKTTLASELSEFFDTRIIHLDDFYNQRGIIDLDVSTDGNINYERFKKEILEKLDEEELIYNIFDCSKQKISNTFTLKKKPLTIIEGSYSLNPKLGKYYDISIFMKLNNSLQIDRLSNRNPEKLYVFLDKWAVLENRYNNFYKISDNVDILIEDNKVIDIK